MTTGKEACKGLNWFFLITGLAAGYAFLAGLYWGFVR